MFMRFFGSNDGIAKYKHYMGRRYPTLLYTFETFIQTGGKTVVELGTSHSLVNAREKGCAINDIRHWKPNKPRSWGWGAEIFTLMCPIRLSKYDPEVYSVDISPDDIETSKTITARYSALISYHCMSSEKFLTSLTKMIDLFYMDLVETEQEADALHLCEAEIFLKEKLLSPSAIIIDDASDLSF